MKPNMPLAEGFISLKIPTVMQLIDIELCKFFYKLKNNMLPTNLSRCALQGSKGVMLRKQHQYDTRKKELPNLPLVHDLQYKKSYSTHSNLLYNELPETVKNMPKLASFVTKLKQYVYSKN